MAASYEQYLKQAETLFEAGDVVKAGQIWQAVLKRDPGQEAARAGLYKVKTYFDTRATQDGLGTVVEASVPSPPDRHTLTPQTPELNTLLEAGCALYDAGLLAKAISTWEMALQRDPGNALAKGYIDGARRKLEADLPPSEPEEPAPPPAPAAPPEDDLIERYLRDGCTLFDMGQVEDALSKWERILAIDPHHALAVAYANDARKDLGLPPLAAGEAPPAPPPPEVRPTQAPTSTERNGDDSRADQLVREGVQIYDLGMTEEAIEKWQQALQLEPGHRDAPGYLAMAIRDREEAPPARPRQQPKAQPEAPNRPAAHDPGSLEARLNSAEHLLRNQKYEEAAFAFQCLLDNGTLDARAIQGYQQARAFLAAQEEEQTAAANPPPAPAPAPPPPLPVDPPRAVTVRAPARGGLKLPALPARLNLPAGLVSPRNLALAAGSLLVLVLALVLVHSHQRDVALQDAIAAAKASAMAPIARRSQVAVLTETPQTILREGEAALNGDPLTAYYRAQEGLRLDPGDAAAAQLLERARARLATTAPEGSGKDLDKSMKSGDLESARSAVLDQLRKTPDDAELKAKARIIYLALVQTRATNEQFPACRELLLQGRAMFPQDKSWAADLKLLEELQGKSKAERTPWIPLLD